MTVCCECGTRPFPPEPDIPAGLTRLPRQVLGFPEYRSALLRGIRSKPPLVDWRAREGDDLGLVLLESWAYVLDIVGFYDEQIGQNLYLRTASDLGMMRRLTELIGYRPRPAAAAEALLAAIADRGPDVLVPAGTAFRSEAFGGNPPQVFESDADNRIAWRTNSWTLAQIVPSKADGGARLLFDARTLRLTRGAWAIFAGNLGPTAARVRDLQTVKAVDGNSYVEATVDPAVAIPAGTDLGAITIRTPTATARLNTIAQTPISGADLILDAVHPQLAPGQDVLLISQGTAAVMGIHSVQVEIAAPAAHSNLPALAATKLTFTAAPSPAPGKDVVVHFQLVDAGRLVRPAQIRVQNTDLLPTAPLAGIVEPLDIPARGPLLMQDGDRNGLNLDGSVSATASGVGTLAPASGTPSLDQPLVPPVSIFGNVIHVVRGETVALEVLGSGDATQAFPSFQLKKKPLTYLKSSSAANGRKSTLEVRVNNILWREVDSFYGTKPDDPVYIVRQDQDQNSIATFWRVPSGVDNITARYRFGAGVAAPPADALAQIVRPVKGLSRVLNPVAAANGADADQPRDIRHNAPAIALTLGRAVSLDDFEALARSFGVVNASVGWAWDSGQQRAVVKIWYIADGGDIADALRSFLIGQADPTVALAAQPAAPLQARLVIDAVTDPAYDRNAVQTALVAALSDPPDGLLSHAKVPIGGSLFRSAIFAEANKVPGVAAINGMTVDGGPAPFALTAPEGQFFDFLPFTNS
jgi:hypothetical protein